MRLPAVLPRVRRLPAWSVLALATIGLVVATQPPTGAGAGDAGYVSLASPARILDTRPDGTTVDGDYAKGGQRPSASTLALTVTGRAGVASDAVAVMLNVTATDAIGPGFITAYACDQPQPLASNLNYVVGRNVPNLVIARMSAGGQVCLYNTAPVQLIVDVTGYFTGQDAYSPLVTPARLLDTRPDGATVDGMLARGGIMPAGRVLNVPVADRAGVPVGASTAVLNVTVDGPLGAGFITVFPCGTGVPNASNLNYVAGQTVANSVVARIGSGGAVCVYTSTATHVIVDVAGYFAGQSLVVPLPSPARLLDTRSDGVTTDGLWRAAGLRPTGGTVQLQVSGRAGIPWTASAVILNVTVDGTQTDGFATVYPAGTGRPNASNLNYVANQSIPNAVTARLGTNGSVCVFTSGATHVVVDVAGYILGDGPPTAGTGCPADPVVVAPVAPVAPVTPVAPVVTTPVVTTPVAPVTPAAPPATTPAGSQPTAICKDGTPSYSKTRSGTCSHHGGVAVWL